MFYILKFLCNEIIKLDKAFYNDPRVSHLPLIGAPWKMFSIIAIYLLLVTKLGPQWMQNRKPFNVKPLMIVYNAIQVLLSAYIFINSVRYSYLQPNFNIFCQPYNTNDTSPTMISLITPGFVYYMTKYIDFLDTVFFVLRKKSNQLSFLHIYHHSIMVFGVWAYLTLMFGSHFTLTGILNSFVHTVMYMYYFTAALDTGIELTAWKRRLTQLQILQFSILWIHYLLPILNNSCGLSNFWIWLSFIQNSFILTLFCDFYYNAYLKKKGTKAKMVTSNEKKPLTTPN